MSSGAAGMVSCGGSWSIGTYSFCCAGWAKSVGAISHTDESAIESRCSMSVLSSEIQVVERRPLALEAHAGRHEQGVEQKERRDAEPERAGHARRQRGGHCSLRMDRAPDVDRQIDERHVGGTEQRQAGGELFR